VQCGLPGSLFPLCEIELQKAWQRLGKVKVDRTFGQLAKHKLILLKWKNAKLGVGAVVPKWQPYRSQVKNEGEKWVDWVSINLSPHP
jgi:hypothetical protein